MDPIDAFNDYTTKLSDEEFNAQINRILMNDQKEDEDKMEWTLEGQKICKIMLPALISYINFAVNYNYYVTDNTLDDIQESSKLSSGYDKFIIHSHDILLRDYRNIEPITFMQFNNMLKEIGDSKANILAVSYKNNTFNVNIIEYTSDVKKYKEAYRTHNIALYFLSRSIKRLSGKASTNGKDIIAQFNERLLDYGYRIEKGKTIIGVVHSVTELDAENITKVLRKINNAMHNDY